MVPVYTHINTADEFLTSLFGAIGRFGEEDEAGACTPCRFAM
jgi:hypothetical protein